MKRSKKLTKRERKELSGKGPTGERAPLESGVFTPDGSFFSQADLLDMESMIMGMGGDPGEGETGNESPVDALIKSGILQPGMARQMRRP